MKWLILALMFACQVSYATDNKEACLQSMRQIARNCSMKYHVTYTYPDGSVADINGRVAIKNELFYDSSNIRTMIMNRDWYMSADHENGYISLLELRKLTAKEQANIAAQRTRYLIDETYFNKNAAVQVIKEDNEKIWLSVKLEGNKTIEKLVIRFSRKTFQPEEYQAVLNIPINDAGQKGLSARVNLTVSAILPEPDKSIFDEGRFLESRNHEIVLKKFKTYKKILYTNSKK